MLLRHNVKYIKNLVIRLILCFVPLSFFSFVFTPLTVYASYFVLNLVFDVIVSKTTLLVNGFPFKIIEACVASLAYYLLWLLCFLTNDISIKKRLKIILYGFLLIFFMNIFRIFLIVYLGMKYGFFWFNLVHMSFWYFITGLYVAFVWIFLVVHYKIYGIPIYSDIKKIYRMGFSKKAS